jgi:hypothetical protein
MYVEDAQRILSTRRSDFDISSIDIGQCAQDFAASLGLCATPAGFDSRKLAESMLKREAFETLDDELNQLLSTISPEVSGSILNVVGLMLSRSRVNEADKGMSALIYIPYPYIV